MRRADAFNYYLGLLFGVMLLMISKKGACLRESSVDSIRSKARPSRIRKNDAFTTQMLRGLRRFGFMTP